MENTRKSKFPVIYVLLVILFCYLPIASLVLFSFNSDNSLTNWGSFSFKWYIELFSAKNYKIQIAIFNTILIAVLATIISVIIGTIAAIALTKSRRIIRDTILSFSNIPILNPEIVTAVALLLLFTSFQIELGYLTLLLSHVAFCTPYVIITVYPKLRQLDPNLIDAAQDLGASPFMAVRKVILPQIKFAVLSGAFIAFTMSFDDFVISFFTAGNGVENISIYLYTLRPTKLTPMINALSTIIIVIIGIGITGYTLIDNFIDKRRNKLNEENNN